MSLEKASFDIKEYYSTIIIINKFLTKQEEILRTFFLPNKSSFFRQKEENKVNLTSTSTCILSLNRTNSLDKFKDFDKYKLLEEIFILPEWTSTGLDDNNPYTISLLLPGIHVLLKTNWKENLNPKNIERISKCLKILKDVLMGKTKDEIKKNIWDLGGSFVKKYPPNSFLTYWALKTFEVFEEFDPKDFEETHYWTLFNFYKQITYFNSQNYEKFDVYQLTYCLLILLKFFNHAIPKNTVRHVLEIIFKNQNILGRWDKGHPLFNYPEVGYAYCFDFEMLRSLLEDLRHYYFDIIVEFINPLNKTLHWVNENYQND